MSPSKTQLDTLETLAIGAGAVRDEDETPWVAKPMGGELFDILTEPDGPPLAEEVMDFAAHFIAAANPTVVLELVDEIRKLRARGKPRAARFR